MAFATRLDSDSDRLVAIAIFPLHCDLLSDFKLCRVPICLVASVPRANALSIHKFARRSRGTEAVSPSIVCTASTLRSLLGPAHHHVPTARHPPVTPRQGLQQSATNHLDPALVPYRLDRPGAYGGTRALGGTEELLAPKPSTPPLDTAESRTAILDLRIVTTAHHYTLRPSGKTGYTCGSPDKM